MTPILLATAWLLTYLIHSTLLLSGAWVMCALRIVRTPGARDVLWKVAMVGGILTASTQIVLDVASPLGSVSLTAAPESSIIEAHTGGQTGVLAGGQAVGRSGGQQEHEGYAALEPEAAAVQRLGSFHAAWPGVLLNLWLFGALACGAGLFWARRELRRRVHGRRDVTEGPLAVMLGDLVREAGYTRRVRLTVSSGIAGPISFGGNEICLPERATLALGPGEQRAVLAHELGHLVRRDPRWQLFTAMIASILFFQPLNRLARRRLCELAEYLCDDWAAARSGGGIVLARCLAEVATWMRPESALAAVPGMAARPSQLVARVERLLDGGNRGSGLGARGIVAVAGVAMLVAVAYAAPGVGAGDLGATESAAASPTINTKDHDNEHDHVVYASLEEGGDGWLAIRDGGRRLIVNPGYTVRLAGQGRIGFREWGRAFELADGYSVLVNGRHVDEHDVCGTETVTIVGPDGALAWTLTQVRLEGPSRRAFAALGVDEVRDLQRVSREWQGRMREEGLDSATLAAFAESKLDAAIDTLVQAWARDPEAVRVAARRLARAFDRDLRPQFEQLGRDLGEELAPSLERVTDRLGRDLSTEFARFGSEIGRAIVTSLGEGEGVGVGSGESRGEGAGSGDFRKPKPKHN